MSKFSLTNLFGMTIRESANDGSDFTNPDADYRRLFLGEDGSLHLKDSAGTVTDVAGASGAMATDSLWDAAGDLAQGTGADTGAKLSAGTLGYFLMAGGAATALSWKPRELDYVQVTTGTTNITATSEATADTMITGSAVSYDGSTVVMVEFFCSSMDLGNDAGTNAIVFVLYDGSSSIGKIATVRADASHYIRQPIFTGRRLTPSNASHTYSIRAYTITAGTGHMYAGAGGSTNDMPAYIRITRAV